MYEYKDFREVFENWDNLNDRDTLQINGHEVIVIGDYDDGYDSEGTCEELRIVSIDGETYATKVWTSSYDDVHDEDLFPVTKKTKIVEYWE